VQNYISRLGIQHKGLTNYSNFGSYQYGTLFIQVDDD